MTEKQIEEQIHIIKKATENALKSKKTTLRFLIEAGIVRQEHI